MDIKIVNHINLNGRDALVELLSVEELKQVRELLQERMMVSVGYKRKTA